MFAAIFSQMLSLFVAGIITACLCIRAFFFVNERVCYTHKHAHSQANTHLHAYTHYIDMCTCYAFAYTWTLLAEIVYDTIEVSKCVFKRTLYLDSFPLRLRSVRWLRDDNENFCAILLTTDYSVIRIKFVTNNQRQSAEQTYKIEDGAFPMPSNRCKFPMLKSDIYCKFIRLPCGGAKREKYLQRILPVYHHWIFHIWLSLCSHLK